MKKFLKEEFNLVQVTKIAFAIYGLVILTLIYHSLQEILFAIKNMI